MYTPRPCRPCPAAAEPLEPRTLLAASPALIDLNPQTDALFASRGTPVGDQVFFTLHSTAGNELWKSDGTPTGTRLVRDINPGRTSSDSDNLVALDDKTLLFSATSGKDNSLVSSDLWKSDGTRRGTVLVKKLPRGRIQYAFAANGLVFFSVEHAHETGTDALWVSDGTPDGTRPLLQQKGLDIQSGFVEYKDHVLFTMEANGNRRKLWRSDGTAKRTQPLRHIDADGLSVTADTAVLGKYLIYSRSNNDDRPGLWKATFKRVKVIRDFTPETGEPLVQVEVMKRLGDRVFFQLHNDIWTTDGTPAGTEPFDKLHTTSPYDSPHNVTLLRDMLLFTTYDGGEQSHLWNAGDGDDDDASTLLGTFDEIRDLTPFGDDLLFAASDNDVAQLWTTDGTPEGTAPFTRFTGHRFTGFADAIGFVNGRYLFTADDDGTGHAIWTTDGTPEGTQRLRRVPNATKSSSPSGLAVSDGALYFGTYNIPSSAPWGPLQIGDGSLWRIAADSRPEIVADVDGIVERILPTEGASAITYFTVRQVYNWWGVAHAMTYHYLWQTDGTAAGTRRVLPDPLDISLGYDPLPIARLGDTIVFPYHDDEIWRTDGTDAGTGLLVRAEARDITIAGNTFYLLDRSDRIRASDGTFDGTRVIFESDDPDQYATATQTVGDRLYFTTRQYAADRIPRAALWTFAPDDAQPRLLRQFNSDSIDELYASDGVLLFSGFDPDTGWELWKSDGTAEGTALVKDIHQGPESSRPRDMVTIDGLTYFVAADDAHGGELWRTNGTAKGTTLVADLREGKQSSLITNMHDVAGNLLFSADDGEHGTEPWILRPGESPILLADIFPGREASTPDHFTTHNGLLYFSANDYLHSRELWSAPL